MRGDGAVDDEMRERVWARWVESHPYDAESSEYEKAMLLDTYEAHSIAIRLAAEDMTGPLRSVALRLADDLDARMARLRDEGLRAPLRATR